MRVIKQHIAFLLLAGFLFPQLAGSLHYLVVDHSLPSENVLAYTKPGFDYNYHSCVYHLNGFPDFLLFEEQSWNPEGLNLLAKFNFYSLENYVHQPEYNFQLRGPPQPKTFLA